MHYCKSSRSSDCDERNINLTVYMSSVCTYGIIDLHGKATGLPPSDQLCSRRRSLLTPPPLCFTPAVPTAFAAALLWTAGSVCFCCPCDDCFAAAAAAAPAAAGVGLPPPLLLLLSCKGSSTDD